MCGGWNQKGEAEKPEAIGLWSEVQKASVNPEGESRHRQARAKISRKERENQTRMVKESKWKGTLGRGCAGSKSEKKDGSGGIWRDAGLSGRIIEFAPGRSIRNKFRAKRDQHSTRVYVLV